VLSFKISEKSTLNQFSSGPAKIAPKISVFSKSDQVADKNKMGSFIRVIILLILAVYATRSNTEQNFCNAELYVLNVQLKKLLDESGKKQSNVISKEISDRLKDSSAGCLEPAKFQAFMRIMNSHYEDGNTAPAMLLMTQKFRISSTAAEIETAFNS